MDIASEILNGPEYFYCEKASCKLRFEVCLERQKANETRQSQAFDLLPFPICEKCKQGLENKLLAEPRKLMEKEENQRICEECNKNTTISPNSPLCASCMARRAAKTRKEKGGYKKKPNNKKPDKPIDKPIDKQKERPQGQNTALTIEFGKHVQILREVEKLAEDQLRPVDLQVIYMLKRQLESIKEGRASL